MRAARIAIVLSVALVGGCAVNSGDNGSMSNSDVLPAAEVAPFLEGVTESSPEGVVIDRLADGLLAPTNRWYSGLVFGAEPQPVFPLPLSFELSATGFGMGVPEVTGGPDLVTAPAVAQLEVDLRADSFEVSRYDDTSVTVSALRQGDEVATITIARGSPMVSVVAVADLDLALSTALTDAGGGALDTGAGIVAVGATEHDGQTISLAAGQFVNLVAMPAEGSIADIAESAGSPLTSVETSWNGTTTTLRYKTADGSATLIGALAHQVGDADCSLGSYGSILGEMVLCSAAELTWATAELEPSATLDLAGLDESQRAELSTQLGEDLATTAELPADTYFGGKGLARIATLLELARSLGDDAAAKNAKQKLTDELLRWGTGAECAERCFVYDPVIGGIVGEPASFGSDEFNDHHFHYGYFLYAAAVVARDDAELAEQLRPVMTLLAADIASGETTDSFPARRVFDPYSGHSWASGFSPFLDGNNQESSSEAVAAWNGLALWADVIGDDALGDEARWMLSAEADAATRFYLDTSLYPGYEHEVVGILWDGKVEYGTWFSADPGAMLGIQLLPMQPVASYLEIDSERIRAQVAEARQGTLFADYVVMYEALAGEDVIEAARSLPDASIDDGNSRSYLLAWVMSH